MERTSFETWNWSPDFAILLSYRPRSELVKRDRHKRKKLRVRLFRGEEYRETEADREEGACRASRCRRVLANRFLAATGIRQRPRATARRPLALRL